VCICYPVNTKIDPSTLLKCTNEYYSRYGHSVPQDWLSWDKLYDIDSPYVRRFYFKENPEELYIVQFSNDISLIDVINKKINDTDYIGKEGFKEPEKTRILKRINEEIITPLVQIAKENGAPDSEIYLGNTSSVKR
jgi:hypothetical protein